MFSYPAFGIYDILTLSYARFGDFLDLFCQNDLDIKDTTDTLMSPPYLDITQNSTMRTH